MYTDRAGACAHDLAGPSTCPGAVLLFSLLSPVQGGPSGQGRAGLQTWTLTTALPCLLKLKDAFCSSPARQWPPQKPVIH